MSASHPAEPVIEAFHQFIGGAHFDNAEEFETFAARFGDLFEEGGAAIATLASRLGHDFPIDAKVVQAYEEIASTCGAMKDLAADAYRTHRDAHEAELKRLESPRPGEEMWDVRR